MHGRILITGANGYLGARCVQRCIGFAEREVIAVWHSREDQLPAQPPYHIRYEQCDLTDRSAVEALFSKWKIDAILHTAALLPDNRPSYTRRAVLSNVLATTHLTESASSTGCARFVYCSSISVYGTARSPEQGWDEEAKIVPSSVYGWTKYAGEECLRLHTDFGGLTGISLRLAGIHGSGRRSGVVFHMTRAALTGQPLIVNNPNNRFQLVFIEHAVDAALLALEIPLLESYQCINVASHTFPSLRQIAIHIAEKCGSKSILQTRDLPSVGEYIMNTTRMSTLLGPPIDDVDAHLLRISESLQETTGPF